MSDNIEKTDVYTTPYIEENGGSYTNIYRNEVIFLGSVEKSIARELTMKLNGFEKAKIRVSKLEEALKALRKEAEGRQNMTAINALIESALHS